MKPINSEFLLDLYRRYYPKEYAASMAARGVEGTADSTPRDTEAVKRAKQKIASEIRKDTKKKGADHGKQNHPGPHQ